MINLIRGKIESKLNNEIINSIDDFSFFKNRKKIDINSSELTLNNLLMILDEFKDIEVNIYFQRFTSKEKAIINEHKVNIVNENIEVKVVPDMLHKLTTKTDEEKINLAFNLIKDDEDIRLINESLNNGTLTINSLLRKLVVKYA